MKFNFYIMIFILYFCGLLQFFFSIVQAKIRKISKGIATKAVKDKNFLRAYAIYLDLKGLTKNGCIHHWELRKAQLAKTLDICIPTLNKWIAELLKRKWAWTDNGDLRFLGRRKFNQRIDKVANKQYYNIKSTNFKNIELHLRGLSIEENRQSQEYALNNRIADREVMAAKIKCEKTKEWFKKTVNVHQLKKGLRAVNILTKINKEVTLSRKGIAKVFNLESPKSGTYWAKKLRGNGIIKDESKPLVFIGYMNKDYFRELQLKSKRYLFWNAGKCMCRLPNHTSYLGVNGHMSICK